jgi:hypothetical protein
MKTHAYLAGLLAIVIAPACAERPKPGAPGGGDAHAVAGAPSTPGAASTAESLRFIENDAPRALAEAKSRNVPLFVEAWAPW